MTQPPAHRAGAGALDDPEGGPAVYERPTFPWACARAWSWGRPCPRGPRTDGSCGGTWDCTPFRQNDRYECRRAASAAGPCEEGPRPDGSCARVRAGCSPVATLRVLRGRLAVLAVGLVAALVAAGSVRRPGAGAWDLASANPGPLSGPHASFTSEEGCAACHAAHAGGEARWLEAALEGAGDTLSGRCLACHRLAGDPRAPHDSAALRREGWGDLACARCHTEHHGATAGLTEVADDQCAACHRRPFADLESHPGFGETFPHARRASIRFDHVTHLYRHFQDPRGTGLVPRRCVDCHDAATARARVEPRGFDAACAPCHAAQVRRAPLVLYRHPEIPESAYDAAQVEEVLGERPEGPAEAGAISVERPTALSAWLLGVEAADPEAYGGPVQTLVLEMARDGSAPLAERLQGRAPGLPAALLAGLAPELVRAAARAWAANREYDPPAGPKVPGWQADALELRYVPAGHADPVLQAWLDLALEAGPAAAGLLDVEGRGPGACGRCHAVTEEAGRLRVEWHYREGDPHPYRAFVHRPHIELLGPDASCTRCHALDAATDPSAAFRGRDPTRVSGFHPIAKETCTRCHGPGGVRADCLSCHRYHLAPSFAREMKHHDD